MPVGKTFSVEITGIDNVIAKLNEMDQDATHALAAALYQEAQGLITEAKMETPVLTGALRTSGHVLLPVIDEIGVTVECGFGGVAGVGNVGGESNEVEVGYAFYVHEDPEAFHENGKNKYLEDPFNRRAVGLSDRIAAKMAEKLA